MLRISQMLGKPYIWLQRSSSKKKNEKNRIRSDRKRRMTRQRRKPTRNKGLRIKDTFIFQCEKERRRKKNKITELSQRKRKHTILSKCLKSFNCSHRSCFSVSHLTNVHHQFRFSLALTPTCNVNTHWFARFCTKVITPLPSLQCFFYTGSWLTEICIWDKAGLQNALPTTLTLSFFSVFPVLYTQDTFAPFLTSSRPFCSSLLVSFFRCCCERNLIHTALLSYYISRSLTCFIFIQACTIADSRKRQHSTRGLFERWIQLGKAVYSTSYERHLLTSMFWVNSS